MKKFSLPVSKIYIEVMKMVDNEKLNLHEYKAFSIFDRKSLIFGFPFYAHTVREAQRTFSNLVNNPAPENLFHKYPEDYQLFFVGHWYPETGELESVSKVDYGFALDYVNKSNN